MSADINVGAITEALNNKVDLVNGVPQDAVDYVVAMQRPTADNNYMWYRKYKSGWVEQGGVFTNTASSAKFNSISLPIAMGSTNYVVNTTCASTYTSANSSSHAYAMEKGAVVNNLTTTAFEVFTQDSSSGSKVLWQVSGMAA